MSEHPTFLVPTSADEGESTGRVVINFADDAITEGLVALRREAGISKLPNAVHTGSTSRHIGSHSFPPFR